ncbi:guanine nucleotide-binding protein G(I)/G(S)/G(O) subunit gamma-3-like [Ailuropoda melanoleuca]|uniref:guanine nucleotide-binding protein G(I)/G(S)/G(O) subunit gamma-3-like n=1 Tax=Ailuropoda melanoleuca TaxID=9646 RepID=UPI0014949166|nr:guanine nucleotide-binding protein G(I)/G(S)/G(O) subunit gamma-3-like [Ailuropoda melanoleuca]
MAQAPSSLGSGPLWGHAGTAPLEESCFKKSGGGAPFSCTRDTRSHTCSSPVSAAPIGQARKMVEQLKIEASLCRIKVSKAAADLMTYCDAHACEDPLITPVPTSENPFREKKFFCALL